jgi:MoaA/NifB/PqqE/SkfB family radical SAM enzyme
MPKIHKNTCPALFLDATIDPAGSYSPCTALGGSAYNFSTDSVKTIWLHSELEDARTRSAKGEKLPMCSRCWIEEEVGLISHRQRHIENLTTDIDYTDKQYYFSGPTHLNIKVSNICNLRCRTCQSSDSYLYHIEGAYYEKTHNLTDTIYTKEKFKKHFIDSQIDELFELSGKLECIELYGGEPFLESEIPKLLNRLIDTGASRKIDLKISTNATHTLTDQWKKILTNFKQVTINISIDGIGDKFTYLRHPGIWSAADKNIRALFILAMTNPCLAIIPVITVSALNVWDVPEVFTYFTRYRTEPYLILVQTPSYYCVNILPPGIKDLVKIKLDQYNNKFDSITNLMYTNVTNSSIRCHNNEMESWDDFKFWTKEKDKYRNESFLDTFSEFGQLLIDHKEW